MATWRTRLASSSRIGTARLAMRVTSSQPRSGDALLVSGCLRGRRGRQSDRRNPIRQRRSEPGPPHTQIPGYGGIRVRTQTPAQRRDPYSQRYPHGIAGAGGAGTRQALSGEPVRQVHDPRHLRTVALDFCAILALGRAEWQQIENTAWPSGTFCRLDAFDPRLALGREPFRTSDRCKMPRSETYKWQATHRIEYNSVDGVRL